MFKVSSCLICVCEGRRLQFRMSALFGLEGIGSFGFGEEGEYKRHRGQGRE